MIRIWIVKINFSKGKVCKAISYHKSAGHFSGVQLLFFSEVAADSVLDPGPTYICQGSGWIPDPTLDPERISDLIHEKWH